jgi:hypothetical protein
LKGYANAAINAWASGGNLNTARVGDLNTGRDAGQSTGADNTTSLFCGGKPYAANVESWNGTSWTTTTNMNTGREDLGTAGTKTLALVFGGLTATWCYSCNRIMEWNFVD